MNKEIKLRDALFLTHPKPQNPMQKDLFKKIVDGTLAVPYTWETRLSEAGKIGETKQAVWEELIESGKVGYMAMLRNIRNIIQAEVSLDHIQKVCEVISNEKYVVDSKQLPFRFLSAYRSIKKPENRWGYDTPPSMEGVYVDLLVMALEKAISYSTKNLPMFGNDRILLATDVSGSMMTSVTPKSDITYFDIGAVLGAITYSACRNATAGMFGDIFALLKFSGNNILQNVEYLYKEEGKVGYATNGYTVLEYANKVSIPFDRIMMFTDCQMYRTDNNEYGYGGGANKSAINREWNKYKKNVNPEAMLYIFDLAGYGTAPVKIHDNDVYTIGGWSDKVFDILHSIENGKSALDEINSIEV